MSPKYATFAAGCFWGVEDKLAKIPGVLETRVGYTGGEVENPTYRMVCTNQTGHAEAVRVSYDPAQINYETLVRRFFEIHNPTTLNRQGPDIGSQYRSVVFYHTDEQHRIAERVRDELNQSGKFPHPIVTEIVPADDFYEAEEYHQKYYAKNRYH
jgi:methionine-S-sulfoxide reductase